MWTDSVFFLLPSGEGGAKRRPLPAIHGLRGTWAPARRSPAGEGEALQAAVLEAASLGHPWPPRHLGSCPASPSPQHLSPQGRGVKNGRL
jgi:hypothetical protein